MADWTRGYQETFEYWRVDPGSMNDVERIENVTGCSITRDAETDKIESAKLTIDEDVEKEDYVRCYLVVAQNGVKERICLGTWLMQSATAEYDGKTISRTVECSSSLQELADSMPPIGFSMSGATAVKAAAQVASAHMRPPVVEPVGGVELAEPFVANDNDTWLAYAKDLAAKDGFHITVDAFGGAGFAPDSDGSALTPVWEYDDGNSSIIEADVSEEADWYGIPNTVEVVWSGSDSQLVGKAVNDDENSPVSTAARGREVLKRVTDAKLPDNPTQADVDACALKTLKEESQLEHRITYTHAFNGVKLGDGVSLDYSRHELRVDRAKVVRQEMSCETGMTVKETATYTESLWEGAA